MPRRRMSPLSGFLTYARGSLFSFFIFFSSTWSIGHKSRETNPLSASLFGLGNTYVHTSVHSIYKGFRGSFCPPINCIYAMYSHWASRPVHKMDMKDEIVSSGERGMWRHIHEDQRMPTSPTAPKRDPFKTRPHPSGCVTQRRSASARRRFGSSIVSDHWRKEYALALAVRLGVFHNWLVDWIITTPNVRTQ